MTFQDVSHKRELAAFLGDPDNAGFQLALAFRLRKVLWKIKFPSEQPVTPNVAAKLLQLAGVPDGIIERHKHEVADFLDHAHKALVEA